MGKKKAKTRKIKDLPYQNDIINLTKLCKASGVNYFRVYRRKHGVYKSALPQDVRAQLANALVKNISEFMEDLGFSIELHETKLSG